MPASKNARLVQALLLFSVIAANVIVTLKLPTPPGFMCNSGMAYPGNIMPEACQYRNPVTMPAGQNLADPAIIRYNGCYYMTGTGPAHYTGDIELWSSPDLVNWTYEGIIYHAPRNPGNWNMYMFWAAEIFVFGGYFYLSYSATPDQVMQHHRIGIARSPSITGPYIDMKDEPLLDLQQETIDQHVFEHGGTPFMYYANHDHSARGIYVVQLTPDLNDTVGSPARVLEKNEDESLIEAPWLVVHGGVYHLLFSANGAHTAEYRVGDATASSPLGPFIRQDLVITKNWWVPGPGHCSAVQSPDGAELFIVYHAKTSWDDGWDREVCIDRLFFEADGSLHALGPTRDPQPLPAGVNGSAGVVQIANLGFESASLAGWGLNQAWDATMYSMLVTNPIETKKIVGSGCAFQGQRMLWFWSLISYSGSIQQAIDGLMWNTTYRLVAWGGSNGRVTTIGIDAGSQVLASIAINQTTVSRASIDFTLPPGETAITITIGSQAGAPSSWAWVDGVEIYPVVP